MLLSAVLAVSTATTVAYLLEPLIRDEGELQPLDERRSKGRTERKPDVERMAIRCCRHCGREVNREFTFCGDCARPVA